MNAVAELNPNTTEPKPLTIVCVSEMLQRRQKCIDEVNAHKKSIAVLDRETSILNDEIKDIESRILDQMVRENTDRIETPFGKPTKECKQVVEVYDETLLPEHLKTGACELPFKDIPDDMIDKFKISYNKSSIAAALKDGEVPGARKVPGKPYLKIY